MIGKVDLAMWTKNGERTLPLVLKRINEVIPHEIVGKKIVVDDSSEDKTIEIARSFGWQAYTNPETGIASGANEALRRVTSRFFISFEQDLLLSRDWWEKIPKYMEDEKVAVAQGVRVSTHPILQKLDEFVMDRQEPFLKISIDNNIYRTNLIRKLGGFPYDCPISVDQNLRDKVLDAGFKWIIDDTIVSGHIRFGVIEHAKHGYKLSLKTRRKMEVNLFNLVRIFAFSPIRGLHVAIKKRCPYIFVIYPYIRYWRLKGFLDKKKNG